MLTQFKQFITDVREARIPSWLFWLIMISASIGFLDAGYLSYQHYIASYEEGVSVVCVVGEPGSCNAVLQSQYAEVLGIPLAYIGVLYYLTILVTTIIVSRFKKVHAWYLLQSVLVTGFFASLYFVYLQLFVIYSICIYCMVSASVTTAMFVGVGWYRFKK